MKRIKHTIFLLIAVLVLTNCESEKHEFPVDKRYWDLNDYDKVILELNYGYEPDEKLPSFDDPKTRIIAEKLTDQNNFNVVLDDEELGLKHKNKIAEKFFMEWKNMTKIYNRLNRKDEYLYDKEMLAVWHFGLGLQLKYFKLGNEDLRDSADDPNSMVVKSNINSNIKTIINNFIIYLDEVNNEKAFTVEGRKKFASGIDKYFSALIELYPDANYKLMKNKAELMLKKSKTDVIKSSLKNLIKLIDSKKKQSAA